MVPVDGRSCYESELESENRLPAKFVKHAFRVLSLEKMQRRSSARGGGGALEKSDSDPGIRPNSLTKRTSDYSELDTETVSSVFAPHTAKADIWK
jgi:hypothetical protein